MGRMIEETLKRLNEMKAILEQDIKQAIDVHIRPISPNDAKEGIDLIAKAWEEIAKGLKGAKIEQVKRSKIRVFPKGDLNEASNQIVKILKSKMGLEAGTNNEMYQRNGKFVVGVFIIDASRM